MNTSINDQEFDEDELSVEQLDYVTAGNRDIAINNIIQHTEIFGAEYVEKLKEQLNYEHPEYEQQEETHGRSR